MIVPNSFSTTKVFFVTDTSGLGILFSNNSVFEKFSAIFGKVSFSLDVPSIEKEGLTIFVVELFLSKFINLVKKRSAKILKPAITNPIYFFTVLGDFDCEFEPFSINLFLVQLLECIRRSHDSILKNVKRK